MLADRQEDFAGRVNEVQGLVLNTRIRVLDLGQNRLEQLFETRRPFYESLSRLTVDTDSGQVKQITQRIIHELSSKD